MAAVRPPCLASTFPPCPALLSADGSALLQVQLDDRWAVITLGRQMERHVRGGDIFACLRDAVRNLAWSPYKTNVAAMLRGLGGRRARLMAGNPVCYRTCRLGAPAPG